MLFKGQVYTIEYSTNGNSFLNKWDFSGEPQRTLWGATQIPTPGPGTLNHPPIPLGHRWQLLRKHSCLPLGGTAAARESPSPKVMPVPQGQPTPMGRAEKLRAQQSWGPSFLWPGPPWEELQAGTPKPQRVPVLSGLPLGSFLFPLSFFLCKTKSSASSGRITCCK